MPDVSVIIPAYNEENYILKTLDSLNRQTWNDFETIIVTNGCTDKTEEMVKKRLDGTIRHLSLPQPNVSVARNAGALNASGNILVFLDADTILGSDALQHIRTNFTSEYSVATMKSKPDALKLKYRLALAFKNFYLRTGLYQGCSGILVCHKEHFQNVKGYDPELAVKEHYHLARKLRQYGKYACLNATVTTSMRRFEQWGLVKGFFFWVRQWVKDKTGQLKESTYEKVR